MVNLSPMQRQRLQRGAEHLHSLGARAQAEFLAELAARIGGLPACLGLLEEFEKITPRALSAAGGDSFPPRPVRLVA